MSTSAHGSVTRHVENWRELHKRGYFAEHRRYQERLNSRGVSELSRLLAIRPSDVLLELGCGYGRALYHMLPRVKRAIGIDLAPEPLREAGELLTGRGKFTLHVGDGVSLRPVDDDCVDKAFAFTVIQHLTRAQATAYVAEFARVLKPGGRVCLQFLTGGDTSADQSDAVREQSLSYSASQIAHLIEGAKLRITNLELGPTNHAAYFWYWMVAEKVAVTNGEEKFEHRAY
jgi:cyclopropane fatty-acyl-phospholipid synthase-like methyltransferase